MRKKGLFIIVLVLVALAGILYPAFPSLTNWIAINNIGKITTSTIAAKSGSADDIQAAVDAMNTLGGGTVYVPAGNFTFNINYTKSGGDNRYCGVKLYGGVNIIGAGNNQTILYTPLSGWHNTGPEDVRMFTGVVSNGKSIRISGILFQGSVNMTAGLTDVYGFTGIALMGVKDYRIDHCTFLDFESAAISVSNNYAQTGGYNNGVIDHNIIDQPYKNVFWNNTGVHPIWGYGIIVCGNYPAANWYPTSITSLLGQYTNNTCFIEDNSFARCRHMIAGGSMSGGFYIARFNNFTDAISSYYGSFIDVHGGARGMEFYNNTLTNVATDYRSGSGSAYQGLGCDPRGGGGLIYNNTFVNWPTGWAIQLTNDQSNPTYKLTQYWVWSNTFINSLSTVHIVPNSIPITQDIDYFLRAPNQASDGFSYTPYQYPHPLTQSS